MATTATATTAPMPQEVALSVIIAQMPNARSEIVQRSLSIAQKLDLSRPIQPTDVARADGFSDEELRMMNIFIDPAFNNGRVYLAPEFVKYYLTGASNRGAVANFYSRVLVPQYHQDIDYFVLDPQNANDRTTIDSCSQSSCWQKCQQPTPKGGRPTSIFYAVSGPCFQDLIMQAHTDAGKQLRTLYIRLVALVPVFTQLINFAQMIILKQQSVIQQQEMKALTQSRQLAIEEAEQSRHRAEEEQHQREEEQHKRERAEHQRELAESRYVQMRTLVQATQKPTRTDWIYIATSPSLAKQNHFKPGSTDNLRKRLTQYNCGRAEGDLMFFVRAWRCYRAPDVELMIGRALKNYADKSEKEMVILPFSVLLRIVEGFVGGDLCAGETLTSFVDNFDAHMSAMPEAMNALNLDELEPSTAKPAKVRKIPVARTHKAQHYAKNTMIASKVPAFTPTPVIADPVVSISSVPSQSPQPIEVSPTSTLSAISTTIATTTTTTTTATTVPVPLIVQEPPRAWTNTERQRMYRTRQRCLRQGLPMPVEAVKVGVGRHHKYATEEERRKANAEASRKFRARNKQ